MLDKSHRDSAATDPQCEQGSCDLADGRRIGEGDQVPFQQEEYLLNTRGIQEEGEWHKCSWPVNVEEEQESL